MVHWILNDPAYEHSVPCCVPLHCILAQSISTVYMYKIAICHKHNWQLKTSKIITLQEKHTLMNSCFLMQMTSNLCSHSHKLANTFKSKTGRHWGFQLIGHFIMWYFKNFNLTVFSEPVWCSFFYSFWRVLKTILQVFHPVPSLFLFPVFQKQLPDVMFIIVISVLFAIRTITYRVVVVSAWPRLSTCYWLLVVFTDSFLSYLFTRFAEFFAVCNVQNPPSKGRL